MVQQSPGLFFGKHRQTLEQSPDLLSPFSHDLEGSSNERILLPAMQRAGQSLAEGTVPLWNSSARFGEPFALSGAALYYPPFWLLMLDGGPWLLDLVIFLHSVLACGFMYRFLRSITMSRYVAFLGGGSYGLGWFMTVAADRLPEAAAAALIPLALERTWRCLFSRRRLSMAPLLGLSIGLMFMTTGSSTAWLGFWLCLATFAVALRAIDSFDRRVALKAFAVAILVAGTVSSPIWLDSLQHAGAKQVTASSPVRHLQPAGMMGLVAPGLFVDLQGAGPNILRDVNPGADPMELALYPGALVLYLVLLGLFRPKRTYQGLMWLFVLGAGILMALDGPIAEAIDALTGWSSDRPGATLVLVHLSLVILGSIAFENYLDSPNARRFSAPLTTTICIFLPASFILFCLLDSSRLEWFMQPYFADASASELARVLEKIVWRYAPHALALGLIALVFVSWRRFGVLVFKPAVAALALGELCMISLTEIPRSPEPRSVPKVASELPDEEGRIITVGRGDLPPTSWLTTQGQKVVNSEANAILDRSAQFLAFVDPRSNRERPRGQINPLSRSSLVNHPLLALASVHSAISAPRPWLIRSGQPPAAPGIETSTVRIHRGDSPLGRARMLFQSVAVKDQDQAAEVVQWRADELEHLVVLENPPDDFFCRLPTAEAKIEWLEDSPNLIRLHVDIGEGRGYLLLTDALAPGWEASIDGEESRIIPADLAFRALAIREGAHEITFAYRPWSAGIGSILMLGGLAFGLLFSLTVFFRAKR